MPRVTSPHNLLHDVTADSEPPQNGMLHDSEAKNALPLSLLAAVSSGNTPRTAAVTCLAVSLSQPVCETLHPTSYSQST